MATRAKSTNEQEFQGAVVGWANAFIQHRRMAWLDKATQEKPGGSRKRNDFVIWTDRMGQSAFLCLELKTPTTSISDPGLFNDALAKAQSWGAPYFGIWNMQHAELYLTPIVGDPPATVPLARIPTKRPVKCVEDWLDPKVESALQSVLHQLLDAAVEAKLSAPLPVVFDAEVFVSRLEEAIKILRRLIYRDLHKAATANKRLRSNTMKIAAEQGFAGFVEDIDFALAGQVGYRLVGQVLFYFALRRKNGTLPDMDLDSSSDLQPQLRNYWDQVRRYDYEALYGPADIETLVPLSPDGKKILLGLVATLKNYDWSTLQDDVLGTIFERLIPREEQILLGQFYTPKPVADLLMAMVVDGESPLVLDPGCGSGTFLMSAYDYHAKAQGQAHSDILPRLWGFDLSPFATELATINLYRQDFSSFDNFPRILPGSFFDRQLAQTVSFPPPRPTSTDAARKQSVPVPSFDAVVANPPYLRSQNQDDLDAAYKGQLFATAANAGVTASAKTDLFAFFLFHARQFVREHGRVGFVTPSSWLSSDYGVTVQRFLTHQMSLVAVVSSEAESFFSQVDVNTVLFVAERTTPAANSSPARFVTLKQPIADITAGGGDYWGKLLQFASELESFSHDREDDRYRVKLVPISPDADDAQRLQPATNWAKYLRAPLSYYTLFGANA